MPRLGCNALQRRGESSRGKWQRCDTGALFVCVQCVGQLRASCRRWMTIAMQRATHGASWIVSA